MGDITSRFLALHPHCVSFDPRAVAKVLRWFRQHHTKAFQIYSSSKDLFLLLLGSTVPSKEVVFIGLGSAGRNVWLSVCVFLPERVDSISAITTGNDQPFALKSQQRFSLFHLSPETQDDITAAAPPHTADASHSPCSALPSASCHQTTVRMQNKRLLA